MEYFNPFPLTTFTFKVSQTFSVFDVRSERAKAGWAAGPGGEDDGRRRFLFVDIGVDCEYTGEDREGDWEGGRGGYRRTGR